MSLAPRKAVRAASATGIARPVQYLVGLIVAHLVAVIVVIPTGGWSSPLYCVLFLCLFLSTMAFGKIGAITSALWQLVFLATMVTRTDLPTPRNEVFLASLPSSLAFLRNEPLLTPVTYVTCLFAIGLTTGFVAHRSSQKAANALRQVQHERDQIEEAKWLTDTILMMQSLDELEQVLSVALLQLTDRFPVDMVAIYLCEPDEPMMRLAQTMGLPKDQATCHQIPLSELSMLVSAYREPAAIGDKNGTKLWITSGEKGEMGDWARVDYRARTVLVAPLQTLEEVSGAIYVAAHTDNKLTEEHRRLLDEFARQVLYPIQRVRLQALATTDALTGLFNRRVFLRHLREEVERSRRYGPALSLLMLDIDHFKQVNDTLGHRAGDFILSQLAALLQRNTRGTDTAVRYGGEEMAILCPETRLEEAGKLAERVRNAVEKYPFLLPSGEIKHITISIGVATLTEEMADGQILMEAADQALYAAKRAGRNRVSTGVEAVSH